VRKTKKSEDRRREKEYYHSDISNSRSRMSRKEKVSHEGEERRGNGTNNHEKMLNNTGKSGESAARRGSEFRSNLNHRYQSRRKARGNKVKDKKKQK